MDAAMEAVRKHGTAVSMDQIAAEAKTSKSILYRYFGEKTGLQLAIGERFVRNFTSKALSGLQIEDDVEGALLPVIDSFLGLMESDPEIYFFIRLSEFEGYETTDRYINFDSQAEEVALKAIRAFHPGANLTTRGRIICRMWADGTVSTVIATGERWLKARLAVESPERYGNPNFDETEFQLGRQDRQLITSYLVTMITRILSGMVETTWSDPEFGFIEIPE